MSTESALTQATRQIASVRSSEGFIEAGPFLAVCRLVLPVVDKLGTAFSLVKGDIQGNIQRLADRAATDSARYAQLFAIVQDEVVAGTCNGSSSCTKGLLWLKRAMEFMLAIVKATVQSPDTPLHKVVAETYNSTLMQYHGFLVSSAFTLAFKFVPTREAFVESVGAGSSDDVDKQMQDFVSAFTPVLQDIHKFLVRCGLDQAMEGQKGTDQAARVDVARVHEWTRSWTTTWTTRPGCEFLARASVNSPLLRLLRKPPVSRQVAPCRAAASVACSCSSANMNLEHNLEDTKSAQASSKQEEQLREQGQEVLLDLLLPDGTKAQHRFPAGVTVAYVKLVVEQQHGHPVAQQQLKLADKVLLDPFSLCDYPAMQAGKQATVAVELKGH